MFFHLEYLLAVTVKIIRIYFRWRCLLFLFFYHLNQNIIKIKKVWRNFWRIVYNKLICLFVSFPLKLTWLCILPKLQNLLISLFRLQFLTNSSLACYNVGFCKCNWFFGICYRCFLVLLAFHVHGVRAALAEHVHSLKIKGCQRGVLLPLDRLFISIFNLNLSHLGTKW